MHAAKHFDPQIGIDIHLYVFPPLPTPIPLPTPHIGIVLDPFDYLPIIGGTIHVNGVKRATAGTGGLDIHIPLGPWMPTLKMPGGPQFEDEIFMGSMTVVADGDPMSRIGMPVLDCNIVGLINPFRLKKPKKPQLSMSLPTAVNLAIPNAVNVGGPPMISIMGMAFRGLFAGLGRLRKTKGFRKAMDKFREFRRARFANLPPGLLKCKVLRAEPVDIRRGSVELAQQDFSVPGRLPLDWVRRYTSSNDHVGACGHGWETPADIRLEITADGPVVFQPPDGAFSVFSQAPATAFDEAEPAWSSGARLARVVASHGSELQVRTPDDLVYVFKAPQANVAPLREPLSLAIERIEDLCGNHWRFERVDGRLVRIVESGIDGLQGRFLSIDQRAGLIHHIALHDPASGESFPLVRYRYDEAAADLIAAHDALDAARSFEYAGHRMVRHTDRVGLSFHYAYGRGEDDAGKVVHAWGDGGLYDYRFAYSQLLRETEITDSLGHVSVVKFDANDLPLCEIDPLGGVTVFEYDDVGRTTAIVDPAGLRTGFAYDDRGNLVRLKQADDSEISTAYDARNRPTETTDAEGAVWVQQWNAFGQLVEQRSPMGAVSRYAYDATGRLGSHTDPLGAVTRLAFDRHGLLSGVTDALGNETHFRHDAMGRLLQQTDAGGRVTTCRYDAKCRLLAMQLAPGEQIACAYDAEDRLIRYRDEAGHETLLEYFGTGQIARRTHSDGHTVHYTYDTQEQLSGVVNARGETYSLRRDALGRIVEEQDYWGQSRRYTYSANGQLRHSIDPLGRVVGFETDKLGRIVKKLLPDVRHDGSQRQESFRYDKVGRLVEMRNPDAHVTRRYDRDGRLLVEEQNGFKVENRYDLAGERIQRMTDAGNTVTFDLDLCGRASRIAINYKTPITIERDAIGRVLTEQLGPQLRRTQSYDSRGLLSAQRVERDHAPLFDTQYDYDRAGNLTKRSDSQFGTDRYAYDPLGRVLDHTDPAGKLHPYLNDAAGDRLRTRVRTVEMRQAAGGVGHAEQHWVREGDCDGVSYRFDRAGNLTQRRHQNEPGEPTLRLAWDANQRLVGSSWIGGERDGQVTSYGYDPLGRRVFKRNPTHTTWFYWDGDALVGELTLANAQADEAAGGGTRPAATNAKVVDFMAVRRRLQAMKALHPKAREYVYRPGTFEPFALIDREAKASAESAPPAASPLPPPVAPPSPSRMPTPAGGGFGGLGDGTLLGVAAPESMPGKVVLGQGNGLGFGGMTLGEAPRAVTTTAAAASPAGTHLDKLAPAAPAPAASTSGPVFIFHNDVNGCPVRLTDTRGAIVWSAQYTAWGEAIERGPAGFDQPLRLQGQQRDAETELHYNRHRYYDSVAGQYVTADPLGLAPGENTYGFASNAIRWVDPLGLHSTPVPYGGDDLSQMAQIYRMDNGITGGRNVAVFEYLDDNGMPNYITGASGNGLHAERAIANQIQASGIDPNRVTRVYTELAPCPGIRGMQYCDRMLGNNFPNARVTHSFQYGADRASRRQGVKSLKAAVKRLFTCS